MSSLLLLPSECHDLLREEWVKKITQDIGEDLAYSVVRKLGRLCNEVHEFSATIEDRSQNNIINAKNNKLPLRQEEKDGGRESSLLIKNDAPGTVLEVPTTAGAAVAEASMHSNEMTTKTTRDQQIMTKTKSKCSLLDESILRSHRFFEPDKHKSKRLAKPSYVFAQNGYGKEWELLEPLAGSSTSSWKTLEKMTTKELGNVGITSPGAKRRVMSLVPIRPRSDRASV